MYRTIHDSDGLEPASQSRGRVEVGETRSPVRARADTLEQVTALTAALAAPTVTVGASYLAAVVEYQSEGRYTDLDVDLLADPDAFAAFVAALAAKALPQTPRPVGIVPETMLWWVDGGEFLGRISIRHQLTEALRQLGGHIGYDVRPTARRRGHATAMLRAALPVGARLGIDPALVTCDVDNVASRRIIEANGGTPDEAGGEKLRFWVPTARSRGGTLT